MNTNNHNGTKQQTTPQQPRFSARSFGCVTLRQNCKVEIPAGASMELRGKLNSPQWKQQGDNTLQLRVPDSDNLPLGLEISLVGGDVAHGVHIIAKNSSRHTLFVGPNQVLVECYVQGSGGIKENDATEQGIIRSLVGPACETQIQVEDIACTALADSGSQVTTVCRSFYSKHLSHLPIESLKTSLRIDGAGGQDVPYDGYIRLRVKLPKEVAGVGKEVCTMALVCPNTSLSSEIPVVLGTNTFSALAENNLRKGQTSFLLNMPVRTEVAHIYQSIVPNSDGWLGSVRLMGSKPVTISAGTVMEIQGVTRKVNVPPTVDTVVLQESLNHSTILGEKLAVQNCLVSAAGLPKVKVFIQNMSNENVTIKPKKIIADLYVPQEVNPIDWVYNRMLEDEDSSPSNKAYSFSAHAHSQQRNERNELEFDFENSPLPEDDKQRIIKRLNGIREVFATHEFDIGKTDQTQHRIDLTDAMPFRERARPIRPQDYEDARRHIQQMVDADIIRPSNSPFASPIVLVRKKSGSLRLCVDYRKLNARTVRDSYPIPKVEDLLAALHGSSWFTQLDVKSAFYTVPMDPDSAQYTAFTCPFGLFEYSRMSMGLVNSPLTFQRLMERCVGDLNLTELVVYMDDLIIFASDIQQHEERLFRTLQRLKKFGLKLDPGKCKFFQTTVTHLGHVCSKDGIRPDPNKISAVMEWPIPDNIGELKSFLGFAGYYRRFVKDFSRLCKPLNALTSGYVPRKTLKKMGKSPVKNDITLKTPFGDKWTAACQEAFDTLKDKLTTAPVLGYADMSSPFELHTDASGTGLGAVLYQEQDSGLRVIAYASRGLSKSEANYPAHKREFLALKWAVTDKFHDYLYGSKFVVVTDNNPLTYVLKSAKVDATGYRWLAALAAYDFSLRYRPGVNMTDADALSRLPRGPLAEDERYAREKERIHWLLKRSQPISPTDTNSATVNSHSITALLQSHGVFAAETKKVGANSSAGANTYDTTRKCDNPVWVEALSCSQAAIPNSLAKPSETR